MGIVKPLYSRIQDFVSISKTYFRWLLLRILGIKESKVCIRLSLSIHQESRDEIRQNQKIGGKQEQEQKKLSIIQLCFYNRVLIEV